MPRDEDSPLEDTVVLPESGGCADPAAATARSDVRFDFGAASHTGLRRPNNEDHYAIVRRTRSRKILLTNVDTAGLTLPDDQAYALIVADGMGGRRFGEQASELILRIGWELAGAAPFWVMKFQPGVLEKIRDKIANYGRRIQEELQECAAADPRLAGMATTWTCAYLMGRDAILAHVGDSRAYLFRDGRLKQLTRDHTFAQILRDDGLSAEETKQFSHLLVNSFGADVGEVHIDVDHVPLKDGDRLLLCSDGLTSMVNDAQIAATLSAARGGQAACDALIESALENGGKDNVTVLVADVG